MTGTSALGTIQQSQILKKEDKEPMEQDPQRAGRLLFQKGSTVREIGEAEF